ncbi:MAG: arsenate reductase (glutaredoxin) [Oceanobacter sp.]
MSEILIYHNPRCSKSRETLALLQEQGQEPTVIEYLKQAPTKEQLQEIVTLLGMESPRELMRTKEAEYKEQNLADASLSYDQLLDAMVTTPKLMERPVVLTNGKARIGRPPESVLEILG